ncbi:hypothetical protein JCGZ_22438 [Jatropha curcas]|uniref:Uncharacterized protein n=1 Tax=Jatropha curcas TaxID=180498 RepID=A0A067JQQ2_JATCU|nr:hypothetical protein JCGZ_22438 [Jatropha curcas]
MTHTSVEAANNHHSAAHPYFMSTVTTAKVAPSNENCQNGTLRQQSRQNGAPPLSKPFRECKQVAILKPGYEGNLGSTKRGLSVSNWCTESSSGMYH